jgi:hypothetical protein
LIAPSIAEQNRPYSVPRFALLPNAHGHSSVLLSSNLLVLSITLHLHRRIWRSHLLRRLHLLLNGIRTLLFRCSSRRLVVRIPLCLGCTVVLINGRTVSPPFVA